MDRRGAMMAAMASWHTRPPRGDVTSTSQQIYLSLLTWVRVRARVVVLSLSSSTASRDKPVTQSKPRYFVAHTGVAELTAKYTLY
jgi:hypothetical protein